jgi:hypothetical protein
MTLACARHLFPLLLGVAGISSLAAETPIPLVIREDQRLSVAGLAPELAAKSFGGELHISGDTAIFVGSGVENQDWQLGVYIYVFQNGSWIFQQRILGTEVGEYSEFGHAIAIDGDTVVISASAEPKGEVENAGCLLVYVRNNGAWTLQAKLQADDAAAGNFLGDGIAIDGDTILTLAHGDINNLGSNAGNAYFFHRQNGVWTQQGDLPTSSFTRHLSPYEERPCRVALHGDLAVVGAPFDSLAGRDGAGRVFLFRRANGVWSSGGMILPSPPQNYEFFGTSVATDGETLLVSAVQSGVAGGEGKVHAFRRAAGSWEPEQVLTDGSSAIIDPTMRFGATLDIVGDTALIGGPGAGIDGLGSQAGSAFIFRREESGDWKKLRRMLPDGTDNGGTGFGSAMALHGRDAMLIANKEEDGSISFDPTLNNRGVIVALSLIEPEGMPLHLLNLADSNHDESLDSLEWNALFPVARLTMTVFGHVDWNRSDSVDYLELDAALADPGAPAAYLLWMDYLQVSAELDIDGNRLFSRNELLQMWPPGKAGNKSADAFIKRLKLPLPITTAQWFRGKGLPTLAQYDAAQALRVQRGELAAELDTNDDDLVSREEFAALFPVNFAPRKIDASWRQATGTAKKATPPTEISYQAFIEAPVLPKGR